jgi:hypothetical protein
LVANPTNWGRESSPSPSSPAAQSAATAPNTRTNGINAQSDEWRCAAGVGDVVELTGEES